MRETSQRQRLESLRKRLGYPSQAAFADALGMTDRMYRMLIKSKDPQPITPTLSSLIRCLDWIENNIGAETARGRLGGDNR